MHLFLKMQRTSQQSFTSLTGTGWQNIYLSAVKLQKHWDETPIFQIILHFGTEADTPIDINILSRTMKLR